MAKTESIVEAWQLTLDEYKQRPDATEPENGSVLAINLKHETSDSMQRFSGRELSALALLTGARRNGKKAVVIESIFSRHRALVALEKETPESLVGLKVGQIDALLKAAGLPASYGNKATKAQKLIGWRARIRTKAKDRLTQSLHLLEVSNALKSLKYHRAIAEGKMTVERATLIISSHGLDVPKNINAPLETKRKGGRATRALENAEIQAVFASVGGRYAVRNRAMLMVGIHLALRATELCGLTVGDVYDGARVRTYITIRGEIAKLL
jgi:integrase